MTTGLNCSQIWRSKLFRSKQVRIPIAMHRQTGLGMGYPTSPSHPTSPINPGMGFFHPKLGLVGFVGLLLVKS